MTLPLKAVFLSYAHEDADTARRIAEALRGEGIEVWLDESALRGGEAWDASIRRQIRDCALFVPIISARTQARKEGYFRLEWKLADERSHLIAEGEPFVLPVVADGTKERDALVPKSFLNVQWSWLPNGDVPPAFVTRVQRLLGAAAVAEPASAEKSLGEGSKERSTLRRSPASAAVRRIRIPPSVAIPWLAASVAVSALVWTQIKSGSGKGPAVSAPPAVARATITLPRDAPLAPARVQPFGYPYPSLALSPDGTKLVYVALAGETTRLYLRPLDQSEVRPLPETEGAFHPFFSPDGRWVGFFAGDKVKKISVLGGAPVTLCNSGTELHGGGWGDDGMIYFAPEFFLMRVSPGGGEPEIVRHGQNKIRTMLPEILPGSKAILGWFTSDDHLAALSGDFKPILILDFSGRELRVAIDRGYSPRWLPTGHLVFGRGGGLFAAAFDPSSNAAAREAVPVLDGVMMDALSLSAQFALSATGTLVFAGGGAQDRSTPGWVDREGVTKRLPMPPQTYGEFDLSPDGGRLTITVAGSPDTLWIYDVETGKGAALIGTGHSPRWPMWTPDGKRVVFTATREGKRGIYTQAADGSERSSTLVYPCPTGFIQTRCFPRENKLLIVLDDGSRPEARAFMLALDGSGTTEELRSLGTGLFFQFSPDGRWLCFMSNRSGRSEIYVQRFPSGNQVQASFEGAEEVLWSARGDEIYYRNRDAWMVVPVTLEPELKAGAPRVLFRGAFLNPFGYSWDVAPDGQRFIALMSEQPDAPVTQLQLIVNWTEELKRRVPVAAPSAVK